MKRATINVAVAVPYDVIVGDGLIGAIADHIGPQVDAHRYAVISDENVAETHAGPVTKALEALGEVHRLVFPAGESYKTRETWAGLTDQMLATGFGRDSAIVAVGGGVVGDIGGFVAATFMRGIPVVHVPTTLLAMVDSSIGGKTGVDTDTGKNLVGAFHQPSAVLADISTLSTLPEREFRNGMAEAIKHGAIADEDYFLELASGTGRPGDGELVDLVATSVRIKAGVVSQDEKERGRRAILNFGHTVGHSIERASRFRIAHGEAVAIGMVLEARIGVALGLTEPGTEERIVACIKKVGLPTEIPSGVTGARLCDMMESDKKSRAGGIRFALLERVGKAARNDVYEWTHRVSVDSIKKCLD